MDRATFVRDVVRLPYVWSATFVYVAAVTTIALVAGDVFSAPTGVLLLGLLVVAYLMVMTRRDLKQVHVLVNSTHEALVARVDALTAALLVAGVEVPHDPAQPMSASVRRQS